MRQVLCVAVILCGFAIKAEAATLSMTVVINSAPSTTITCPISSTFTAPVAPGTVICQLTVAPSNWSGTLSLSGPNASMFAISSGATQSLVVGSSAITTPGIQSVTINAAP